MRKIIDGKMYNTDTAFLVCDVSAPDYTPGDFRYDNTGLYRTTKGAFFIAGSGGPLSRWSQPEGDNGTRGSTGLEVVDEVTARRYCERHGTAADYERSFGAPEEG